MNRSNIAQALPIVAAAYGRKFGVKIEVGGDRACTNGQVIRIPEIGDDPLAKTLAWGFLAHEAAHVRFTDFGAFDQAARKGPLAKHILDTLEDVRVENAIGVPYPGTRNTLDQVVQWLVQEGKTSAPKEADSPPMVLGNALLVMARHRYRRQGFLKEAATEAVRVLRKTFPASFVHRLLGLLTEIPGMASTQDAADLAERVVALVKDEAEEPPPPPPPPTPSDESGDESEGEGAGDSGGEGEDHSEDADESGGECEDEGAGASGDAGEDDGESDGEDEDGADQPGNGAGGEGGDGRKALQQALSAGAGDLPGDAFEAVAQALAAQAHGCGHTMLMPSLEDWAGNATAGLAHLAQVRGESAKLKARLQGLVEAHRMVRNRTVRRGRHLSASHPYRAAVNDDCVFLAKDQRTAPNTAIHLLVDLSGSMHGHQDRIALDAAMALAQALEPMRGVSCAVTAFPSLNGQDDQVTHILSHGETVRGRAGAFIQGARGGTPMTGALWFAAADLLARREERKVIMTLTDGAPNDVASARTLVDKASAAGIEMIGVGIATRVDRLFPVAITIGSVADLRNELFGIAERLLLR